MIWIAPWNSSYKWEATSPFPVFKPVTISDAGSSAYIARKRLNTNGAEVQRKTDQEGSELLWAVWHSCQQTAGILVHHGTLALYVATEDYWRWVKISDTIGCQPSQLFVSSKQTNTQTSIHTLTHTLDGCWIKGKYSMGKDERISSKRDRSVHCWGDSCLQAAKHWMWRRQEIKHWMWWLQTTTAGN